MSELPIVIIGAGPQGLAAAAHASERGMATVVLERGNTPAAAVAEWGHIRLFSAWPELMDAAARRLLESTGWHAPTSGYPTGSQWIDAYLAPLAAALGTRVRYGTTVIGVSRRARDKVVDADRDAQPFIIRTIDESGIEQRLLARAVIDTSGTWHQPNPAGAEGVAAIGEAAASPQISYRIPEDVDSYAGRHVAVVGSGHSATHAVTRLAESARHTPGTRVSWLLRRSSVARVFGGGSGDELPERAALGGRVRSLVDAGLVEITTGFRVSGFDQGDAGLTVIADDDRRVEGVAHVFALTGFRPDTEMLREVRTALDPALEAVVGIAAAIDPNIHSCGSVGATGARELMQPETDMFIIGAKSYGRAPTFLALTGYEQVRSVVAHLAGDHEAAARDELVLPDTGVCGGAAEFDAPGDGCCAAPATLQIGSRRALSLQEAR